MSIGENTAGDSRRHRPHAPRMSVIALDTKRAGGRCDFRGKLAGNAPAIGEYQM